MPSVLEDGADWLATQLADYASRSIVYRRLALASDPIDATPTLQTYEVIDEDGGLVLAVEMHDWSFRRSLLVVGGEVIEPRAGDRIADAVSGQEYEVAPIAKEPCSKWGDTSGVMLIVHTKRVT